MNFSNNGLSKLLTGIGPGATAFSFPSGQGARFASNMRIIIWNKSLFADPLSALVAGKAEIAHITTLVGDNATVVARAQEGTTAVVPTNTSGCSITTTSTTTDSLGQAKTYLIVGSAHAGSYTVTATSAGLTNSPLSFTATATRSGTRFLWKNH